MTIRPFLSALLVFPLVLGACHTSKGDGKSSKKERKESSKKERNTTADQQNDLPDESAEFSRWLRAHVEHYWSFAKSKGLLSNYSRPVGVIAGDPHLANFSALRVTLKSGQSAMRYLNIDLDDAGRGPLALDFLRLVAVTKASMHDVKIPMMVDAYIKGLRGQAMNPPPAVVKLLNLTVAEYERLSKNYVDDKANARGLKRKPGKVEDYQGPINVGSIQALLPQLTIIDVAQRVSDDDERNDAFKLWILARDQTGVRRIIELKQWQQTRLAHYQAQLPTKDWEAEIKAAFWPEIVPTEYSLVDVPGQGLFWLREKKITLIDVPYKNDDKESVEYVRQLAEYDSYLLGSLHSRQPGAANLIPMVDSPGEVDAFRLAIREAVRSYLTAAAEESKR